KALVEKVEQVARLIRSKGVGVYFVTQNPLDVPDTVLAQLGNRVQHALRAFTPRDQKAVKAAATTFRQNPKFDTEEVITQLGVGEALVSTLDLKGVPSMVERTLIRPPSSQMGPVMPAERTQSVKNSPVYGMYDEAVDRDSAYEKLRVKAEKIAEQQAAAAEAKEKAKAEKAAAKKTSSRSKGRSRRTDSATDRFVKNIASTVGRQVGNMLVRNSGSIVRGILGSLLKR
ncbi:MAG: helicase HerA-like domain-containing protein, partial [Pseudomonadota bacterium]